MRRLTTPSLSLALAACCAASAASALEFGQPLPANAADVAWVQNPPLDPGAPDPARRTLVLFWSTDMPDGAGLLQRLSQAVGASRALRVLALNPTPADTEDKVRDFLRQNPCPGLSVGLDAKGQTLLKYLPQLGPNQNLQVNLPLAFLADQNGRLLWSDDRPAAGLFYVLGRVAAGQWTLETTARFAQARAEWHKALQDNNPQAAYLASRKLAELEAGNPVKYAQWHRFAIASREYADLDRIFEGWERAAAQNPEMLLLLATTAVGVDDLSLRRPQVADKALRAAYQARPNDPRLLLQIAGAYHRLGNLKMAAHLLEAAKNLGGQARDAAVGLGAATLYASMYGPEHAVPLLEQWPVAAGSDQAKALAAMTRYYKQLAELAQRNQPPAR